MSISLHSTKRVVNDLMLAERFYRALGLQPVSRNIGGEGEARQAQCWLSATGDANAHILILSRFPELPARPRPSYPGEAWLTFKVSDVDGACRAVEAAGGSSVRPPEDYPDHDVRAAVVRDPEGHFIELVGPLGGRGAGEQAGP